MTANTIFAKSELKAIAADLVGYNAQIFSLITAAMTQTELKELNSQMQMARKLIRDTFFTTAVTGGKKARSTRQYGLTLLEFYALLHDALTLREQGEAKRVLANLNFFIYENLSNPHK